ncbi:hypothetical protein D3C85_1938090 [compost metagenome]
MVAMCATGTKGGDECVNAQAALVTVEREARQERYRRGFEKSAAPRLGLRRLLRLRGERP